MPSRTEATRAKAAFMRHRKPNATAPVLDSTRLFARRQTSEKESVSLCYGDFAPVTVPAKA